MKGPIQFIFLFFVCLFNGISHVGAVPVSVTSLPLTWQLPSNSVRCIFQARDGLLWLATGDGLCRYDGYRMRVFRASPQNPGLLSNNDITTLAETPEGLLLVGTAKGMNVLNSNTGKITPLVDKELSDYEIRSIVVDKDGSIWVGTYKRLVRCSSDFKTCQTYDTSLPVTSVNAIYRDTDDNIWASFWGKGLYKYDRQKNRFKRMPRIGDKDNPSRIFQDNEKKYYIATWGEGLWRMYPEKTSQQMYERMSIKNATEGKVRDLENVFGMVQDDKYGYLWLVSNLGLSVVSCRGNELSFVELPSLEGKMNNIFSSILKDKDNNIWIAAFNEGAYAISLNVPLIQNFPFSMINMQTGHRLAPNITSIYKDANRQSLWIVQNRWGLGLFSLTSNSLKFYMDFPSLKGMRTLETVACIGGSSAVPDEIWVGPRYAEEIYVIRKVGDDLVLKERYDLENLKEGRALMFYEDRNSRIWVLTTNGLLVKPLNGKLQKVELNMASPSVITGDDKGNLWFGSSDGIYKARPEFIDGKCVIRESVSVRKVVGELPSNAIGALCVDTLRHEVWVGSKEGHVYTCNMENYSIEDLSSRFEKYVQGSILNILADTLGHIWISSNKSVVEYNPSNKGKMAYTYEDGVVVNSFSKNSCFYDGTGVYFGGNRGITRIGNNPLLDEKAKMVRTLVNDVKVDGVSILDGALPDTYSADFKKRELTLDADARNMQFDFSARKYFYSDKILYAYRIKGVDDKWIYTDENRQFAYYNRLPKGKHTLELKATDVNGLWSDRIVTYTIYRLPAWYETWWAYMLYALAGIALFFLLYRRMKKRMELRNELHIAQIEKDKSEELTQTKLRYFTNVSHDFLTPIAIISCLIDDVEMTYRNNIPQLEQMRSNLRRLKLLIQQVLDFRKMESGNMKLKVALGDLAKFVNEVCRENFVPLMQQKHLNFSCRIDNEQIPAYFDADKMGKVIFNLLSNAYKYTDDGGKVEVMLTLQQDVAHSFARIKVSDTGRGISAENQMHIFKRFFTDKESVTVESNGIGLSLVKDLLTLHHATISVESELGHGTTFTILLPIDKDSYVPAELVSSEQALGMKRLEQAMVGEVVLEKENKNVQVDEKRMLIVEDNIELLDLMFHIFSRRRQVLIAHNGVEALTVIANNEIDIVISDVMMPEMDGLTLCRQLKSDIETSHIPIILLTAKNSPDDRIECYNAGADGYIAKPFELKVLEARIENFLAHKQVRQKEFDEDTASDTGKLEISSIDQKFLERVIGIIEEKLLDNEFDLNWLADFLCMSKSSLYRKIKSITGLPPVEFVRSVRLKHAGKLLQQGEMQITDVAYAVGFSNPKYFSTCFKEQFGMTPKEYVKKQ